MLIENHFDVAAPVDDVWAYLLDVPRVAPCMPGAELTDILGEDSFKGRVRVRMGPVSLTFNGSAQIVERDEAARRVVINAAGAEEKGKGQASMSVTAVLASTGSGTRVRFSQDLTLSGAAAQYGRGMIQDVTNVLMRQFADCLQDNIGRARRGEAPVQTAARPVGGLSLGLTALLMPIQRFFRRLFGTDLRRQQRERQRERALVGKG